MPSGAKKRKAAKKKKEQEAHTITSSTNNNNNNPHGNDDPKSQDERDSDGGDVGSPASQDGHNHKHPFCQGDEEGKIAPSSVQSHLTGDNSVEEATRGAGSTEKSKSDDVVFVKIEKELGPEDLESTRVPVQHVGHDKSSSSSSRSSSSRSSDDESQASEKKSEEVTSYGNEDKSATVTVESEEVPTVAENETLGGADSNSAVETATVDNLVKTVPKEVDHGTEPSAEKSVSAAVESGLKESEESLLASSNGIASVEYEGSEGKICPFSGTVAESSDVMEKTQDSGPHDYAEKQPLVASTPPVAQRTSFLSCCGLFDVFTGSGR